MTLESAFMELREALEELARAVRQVRVHIDDAPRQPALADPFTYGADDIEGWVAEAIAAADEAVERIAGAPELDQARIALATAHERVLLTANRLGGLLAYERVEELARFDEERGGRWARGLGEALERCREQLDGAQRARPPEQLDGVQRGLLDCWQELAERATMGSVSVRATNIGQQVSVPSEVTEGIT
jgi:hypothetical protein